MKRKSSIINEVVINLVVLMVAATALISITVLWTFRLQSIRESFTPLILVLYIVLFAAVIAVFGTLYLSKNLIRPLRKMVEATEKISAGNFDVQVETASENELGMLASAFNSMTAELARRQQKLEDRLAELARMNSELQKTQDQLIISEKLASVGRLAAGVAHEIGNPLSIINGYLEILAKSPNLDERQKDLTARVESELKRINQIIRELLDYSRPPSDQVETVDLNAVILETLKLIEMQKGFNKITPELELARNLPSIQAGRNQLKQVLVNVFLNALDAMQDGGTLKLKTYEQNSGEHEIVAEVSDTGTGIPRQNLSRIFDPFFTTKEPGKGVGLGLSISLKLMQVMNGKIEVDSEPGKGSTFKLKFQVRGGESGQ
jgi:signal transduction histidine kinase